MDARHEQKMSLMGMCSTQKHGVDVRTSVRNATKQVTPSHSLQVRMVRRIQKQVWTENIIITEVAALTSGTAAATFLVELKKLIKEKDHIAIICITVYYYNHSIIIIYLLLFINL